MKKLLFTLVTALVLITNLGSIAKAEEVEVKDLDSYEEFIRSTKIEGETWTAYPQNQAQMNYLVQLMFTKAPEKVIIKNVNFNQKDFRKAYKKAYHSMHSPDLLPMRYGLLSYKEYYNTKSIIVYEESVPDLDINANTVLKGFDLLTTSLAESLKGDTDYESIKNVSTYIFKNFEYNNRGSRVMTIANMHNRSMACQGITFLGKEILTKMGIESQTRLGDSHYWLVAKTSEGDEVTLDPTTDIILKKPNITLGASTSDHQHLANQTKIYDAYFKKDKYSTVAQYNTNLIN